ncbi:hypothetical protein [Bradyrhizobium genosp. A]|uniref:hypothetical protein n=1 Tax=Bradyrhizobium genosp. A TaxID=83626 RepID=UPI003CE8BBCC
MRVLFRTFFVVSCTSALSACGGLPYSSDPVALPSLIDAVKCELHHFYDKYEPNVPAHKGFAINPKAGGTLDIKTQLTRTANGSLSATAPLPFLATLGFSAGYNGSVTSDIKLLIDQYTERGAAVTLCTQDGAYPDTPGHVVMVYVDTLRLHQWLAEFARSEVRVIKGTPRIQLQTLTLTTAFTYTENGNAGIIALARHWGGPAISGSLSSAQTLTLTINGTAAKSSSGATDQGDQASIDTKKLLAKVDAQSVEIKKLSDRVDRALAPPPAERKRSEAELSFNTGESSLSGTSVR